MFEVLIDNYCTPCLDHGKDKLFFFMFHLGMRRGWGKDIISVGVSTQWLRHTIDELALDTTFPHLQKLTVFYSNADMEIVHYKRDIHDCKCFSIAFLNPTEIKYFR